MHGPSRRLSRQRVSHPSKISPRWQPFRITAVVALSTFAESSHPRLLRSSRSPRCLWPDLRFVSPKTHTRMSDDRYSLQSLEEARPWTVNCLDARCLQRLSSTVARCTHSAVTHLRVSSPMAPLTPFSVPLSRDPFLSFTCFEIGNLYTRSPRGPKKGAARRPSPSRLPPHALWPERGLRWH